MYKFSACAGMYVVEYEKTLGGGLLGETANGVRFCQEEHLI